MKAISLIFLVLSFFSSASLNAAANLGNILKNSPDYHRIRSEIISPKNQAKKADHRSMDEIVPGLYLGDLAAAYHYDKNLNITNVASIIDKPKKVRVNGLCWMGLKVSDTPKTLIICHFHRVFQFIESARGSTLVHCRAGVSRSATFVIAYLMWKFDVSFDEAHQYVRMKHPQADPNPGFLAQLKYYELIMRR